MNYQRLNKEEFLYQCGLRINNSMNDPIIASAVTRFGYTADKLAEGKALYDEAIALSEAFTKEHAEVDAAFEARDEAREKAHHTYMELVSLGKVALKNDAKALSVLEINTPKAQTISGWLKQTRSFYRNLLANTDWITLYGAYGITPEAIQVGMDEVLAVEQRLEAIMSEKGDAQNATHARDAKFEELAEWVNDYEIIARIALANQPQLLEKLGIVVKS